MEHERNKKIMGLLSTLEKNNSRQPVQPRVNWTQAEYDREWSTWIDDVSNVLALAGRTASGETFTSDEWRFLDVIHATARDARMANDMVGLRNALARYRGAARHFLGLPGGESDHRIKEKK